MRHVTLFTTRKLSVGPLLSSRFVTQLTWQQKHADPNHFRRRRKHMGYGVTTLQYDVQLETQTCLEIIALIQIHRIAASLATMLGEEVEQNHSLKRDHMAAFDSIDKPRKVTVIFSDLPDRLACLGCDESSSKPADTSPQNYLSSLLLTHGIDVEATPFTSLDGFFSDPTEDEITAYGSDVLNAVRVRNVEQLRSFHASGRPLKCSNQFGESLLHLACRRGFLDVVQFLVDDAQVPLCVKDDYGRTPLHDAFWTSEPHFEVVDFIITRCPDLLYVKDRRGNTPLSFVRRPNWGKWVDFLKQRCTVEKLTPKQVALFRKEVKG